MLYQRRERPWAPASNSFSPASKGLPGMERGRGMYLHVKYQLYWYFLMLVIDQLVLLNRFFGFDNIMNHIGIVILDCFFLFYIQVLYLYVSKNLQLQNDLENMEIEKTFGKMKAKQMTSLEIE